MNIKVLKLLEKNQNKIIISNILKIINLKMNTILRKTFK